MTKNRKRVNISVDKDLLEKARKKLKLFGGKLSTLFNAYLADFVESINETPSKVHDELKEKVRQLEEKLEKIDKKLKKSKDL